MRLKNAAAPTELEQKHVPGIDAPASAKANEKIEVKVKMGFMQDHPSTKEHYIKYIKLLVDGKEVGSKEWKEGGEKPIATFSITLAKTAKIEAAADCNLHGLWISEAKKITVA
jgi:superoxide reductase